MALLISNTQISTITGKFGDHFDTFSVGRNSYVTVIKTPIKQINVPDSINYNGYGSDSSSNSEITYIPVSGVFPAMVISPKDMPTTLFTQLHLTINQNDLVIKVKDDARHFIQNGKTEKVIINNQNYMIQTTYNVQNFFGALYYYFHCTNI